MTPTPGGLHCIPQSSMVVVTLKSSVRGRKISCNRPQRCFLTGESEWEKERGERGDQSLGIGVAEEKSRKKKEKQRQRRRERDGRWVGRF